MRCSFFQKVLMVAILILGSYSTIKPANAALDPESSFLGVNSVLASSSRANPPFTESNSGSRFGDPSLDFLSDHSDSSILHHHSQFVHHPIFESAHTNYETGEMASGLPPLSLEQTREGHQIKEYVDLQLRDRVLHERSYISQSTFFPQVKSNPCVDQPLFLFLIHFHSYAEVAPNSRHEPGPIMAATPYGINYLQQPIHFPLANDVYGVNDDDELMRSGTRFNMQHVHPANNSSSSRDAAHQMLEVSLAPHPDAGVQVMPFGNRRVSVHSHETPTPTPTPTPVNSFTSWSFSGDGEMSRYNYLLHGDPSSKGLDGHTAKKD